MICRPSIWRPEARSRGRRVDVHRGREPRSHLFPQLRAQRGRELALTGRPLSERLLSVLVALGVVVTTIVVLFPFLYAAIFSFAPSSEMFSLTPRLLPKTFTLQNYAVALGGTNFPIYFRN